MDSDPGSTTLDYHLWCRTVFGSLTTSLEGLGYDNLLAARKWAAFEAGARSA